MVRPNFAVLLANMSSERGVRGVRVDSSDDHLFTTDMFHFINETSEYMSTSYTDAMAILPDSVVLSRRRVNFVAFRTDQAFMQDRSCEVNSHVLGITVSKFTDFEEGEVVQIYLNPFIREVKRNQERVCAYWHFDEDGSGHWSQDGCTLTISEEGQLDLCLCDHLTHFAQIIVSKTVFSDLNEAILEILSIIGCCLSIFGITIIVITAAAFKSWRSNDRNKIWIIYVYLCLAVFLLSLCFLLTVFIKFEQANFSCVFVGALLHYSVLSTYCWMLVISILSFRKLALVFASEIPHALVLGSVFAWCTPVLVISILLAVDPLAYSTKYEESTLSGHFCYPKGIALWASVIAPIGLMWFVNWCLYGIMIKSMSASKDIRRHSNSKDNVKSASINFLLAFLCGIPWLSGFFAWNIVAAYIFTLTVSFQGFVLFLLFILGNDRTRNLWVNFFRRKIFRRSYLVAPSDDKPHGSDDNDQYQGVNASTPLTESQL